MADMKGLKVGGVTFPTVDQTAQETSARILDKIESRVTFAVIEGKYINEQGKMPSLSGYNCTDYTPVVGSGVYHIEHAYLGSASSVAFYDKDRTFIGVMNKAGIPTPANASFDVTIPAKGCYIRWGWNAQYTTSIVRTDARYAWETITPSAIATLARSAERPVAVLVDDDSVVGGMDILKTVCDAKGIKCSFAVKWTKLTDQSVVNALLGYQSAGYSIVNHPEEHDAWASSVYNEAVAEADLIAAIRAIDEKGFIDSHHFVAPSGANGEAMREMVSKWCDSAVTENNSGYNALENGRYNIHRVFLERDALDVVKARIDDAWNRNELLVFGCHSWKMVSTSGSYIPELRTLIEGAIDYAKAKGFEFVTYNKAIKDRKPLWDLMELAR